MNGYTKKLDVAGWYRIISPWTQVSTLQVYIQTVWGKSTSEYACIQIAPSIHHPTANVLNCTGKQGRNLPFDAIRITCKGDAVYIDLHYSEAVANIVSFSASATSTNDEVAKFETNNFIPVDDAPEGETVVLTQVLTVIPSGPVAIAIPPAIMELPLAAGFVHWDQIKSIYRKDDAGMVHLVLSIRPTDSTIAANGTVIATLPEGYRPFKDIYIPAYDFQPAKTQIITIMGDGRISISDLDSETFSRIRTEITFATINA